MIMKIEELQRIIEDYGIAPYSTPGEVGFDAFCEWYEACEDSNVGKELLKTFDVESLVGIFGDDLIEYWEMKIN